MGAINCDINNSGGNRWKKMVYKYDLISGKVNEVAYQPGKIDQFYHQYGYDAENRLINVKTSRDHIYWENDASYTYYRHGPLARTVLGELQVQGLDYAYTLQGWLKGVNSTVVGDGTYDMGEDGKTGSVNSLVARDAYGFSLNYFSGDYAQINTAVNAFSAVSNNLPNPSSDNLHAGSDLFNGNIRAMLVNIPKLTNVNLYGYRYDQLNRLVAMNTYEGSPVAGDTAINPSLASQDYNERISYDANGNILGYFRNGAAAVHGLGMDSLSYKYDYYASGGTRKIYVPGGAVPSDAARLTNRLNHVRDSITSGYTEDIDDQNVNNYAYDRIGNLIADLKENIDSILWTVYGKISHISKTDGTKIDFSYDAAGNRITKAVRETVSGITNIKTTFYVRDVSGNVMSIYQHGETAVNGGDLTQTELHLYGGSRLGIYNVNTNLQCVVSSDEITTFIRGNKFFELSNHLGNVLVTINDRKIAKDLNTDGQIDYYEAYSVNANDYFPFGMGMVGRKFSASSTYRYGFNGKENDNEVKGEGNQQDYGMRIYDTRIGKFLSIDPLMGEYPMLTPYQFASNRPIDGVDEDGSEWKPVAGADGNPVDFIWVGFNTDGSRPEGTQPGGAIVKDGITYNFTSTSVGDFRVGGLTVSDGSNITMSASIWSGGNSTYSFTELDKDNGRPLDVFESGDLGNANGASGTQVATALNGKWKDYEIATAFVPASGAVESDGLGIFDWIGPAEVTTLLSATVKAAGTILVRKAVLHIEENVAEKMEEGMIKKSFSRAGKTIGEKDGVKIKSHGTNDVHKPAHAHVTGGGKETRIGPNGKPSKNQPELSTKQSKAVQSFKKEIRKELNKVGKANKKIEIQKKLQKNQG